MAIFRDGDFLGRIPTNAGPFLAATTYSEASEWISLRTIGEYFPCATVRAESAQRSAERGLRNVFATSRARAYAANWLPKGVKRPPLFRLPNPMR